MTGLSLHPSGNYLVTVSADSQWHFLDVNKEASLIEVAQHESAISYTCCCLHPDGLILGTGAASGELKIWDIREQKNVSNLKEHDAAIKCLAFSENGYYVASGSADGFVKVWDLRKLICSKSIEVGPGPVGAVAFDYSGVYLGIGGGGNHGGTLQVHVVKDWSIPIVSENIDKILITFVMIAFFSPIYRPYRMLTKRTLQD